MMFNSIYPPRPLCKNVNNLTPKVEDFNLGGRLHGIYVAPNVKMPQFIIRQFTNREMGYTKLYIKIPWDLYRGMKLP